MSLGSSFGNMVGGDVTRVFGIINMNNADKEKRKANEFDDQLRDKMDHPPAYNIPEEYGKNQGLAQGLVNTISPYTKTSQVAGQSYAQNIVDANNAGMVGKGQQLGLSAAGIASLLSAANNSSNDAATNMSIAGAQQRGQYIDRLGNATKNLQDTNEQMADQRAIKWNQEVNQPYQDWKAYYRDRFLDSLGYSRQLNAQGQGQIIAGTTQNARGAGEAGDTFLSMYGGGMLGGAK